MLPLSLLLVVLVTFVLLRLTGNPVDIFLDVTSTPEQVAALTAKLHLDQPLPVQFLIFLRDLAGGDFGRLAAVQPAGRGGRPATRSAPRSSSPAPGCCSPSSSASPSASPARCARTGVADFAISSRRRRRPVDAVVLARACC